MNRNSLKDFYLVGGTALTLWLGHRKSIDIDLFIHDEFISDEVAHDLEHNFYAEGIETGKNLVRCFISDIKVEAISHRYRLIEDIHSYELIRLAGLKDLAAMKLNAVTNRGTKKDFWDIAALLDTFTLKQMLDFYRFKYPNSNSWQAEKSLTYFNDADNEDTTVLDLKGQNWENVKNKIRISVKGLL